MLTISEAQARTIRVERDGTGDFTTLQPAVNAAAPGDTVLIGPGRYIEYAPFSVPAKWTEPTYVGVSVDNLTLKGRNRDTVIIGPTVANFQGFGPKGIVTQSGLNIIRVEDLTIENVHDGMYLLGRASVKSCMLRGCSEGVVAYTAAGALFDGCVFESNTGTGVFGGDVAQDVTVQDSQFLDNIATSISMAGVPNVTVRNCTVNGGVVGIQYSLGTYGIVSNCIVQRARNVGIVAVQGAQLRLEASLIDGGNENIYIASHSDLSGSDNMVMGCSFATLRFSGGCTANFHGNHILKGDGWLVLTGTYFYEPYRIDLEDNFWGLTDAPAIAAAIKDGNDDPGIHAFVDFEPFEMGPIPTDEQSFGELKARFGRDR
jgi:hypothetical protein